MLVGLIGYRGSGKSTVGAALAEKLSLACIDIDRLIVERAGKSIREIFEQEGEGAFRDLETRAVREISEKQDAVIAFGGGALDREENRLAISAAGAALVYLNCEPAELLRRIAADPRTAAARPHLTPLAGSLEEIQTVLDRREPIWRSMARHELNVTRMAPADAAEMISQLLASGAAGSPGT